MRRFIFGLVALTGACAVSSSQSPPDGGVVGDAQIDVQNQADAAPDVSTTQGTFCGQPGRACTGSNDCCSGECTGKTGQTSYCYDPPIQCSGNGTACLINDACCSGNCVNGSCAQGCSERGTDCSSSTCCAGSCVDNVCQQGIVGCQTKIGAACTVAAQCCTGVCANGACAAATCADRGAACTSTANCCTGTCTNGACTTAPTCAWTGACAGNFACCTGTCTNGQCVPPVGGSACRFLEKQPDDSSFASCYDCISTSCCDAESAGPIDWQACFDDCMSSFSTWDAYTTCKAKCPPPAALTTCVTASCSTECAQ